MEATIAMFSFLSGVIGIKILYRPRSARNGRFAKTAKLSFGEFVLETGATLDLLVSEAAQIYLCVHVFVSLCECLDRFA